MSDDELLLMDGYDDCIAGVVNRFGMDEIVCYDKQKVIEKLMANSDMDEEEAEEFFEFNQLGAWVGDRTPCFLLAKRIDWIRDAKEKKDSLPGSR